MQTCIFDREIEKTSKSAAGAWRTDREADGSRNGKRAAIFHGKQEFAWLKPFRKAPFFSGTEQISFAGHAETSFLH